MEPLSLLRYACRRSRSPRRCAGWLIRPRHPETLEGCGATPGYVSVAALGSVVARAIIEVIACSQDGLSGFIPAHAGTRDLCRSPRSRPGSSPRMRGILALDPARWPRPGSSPRMRGNTTTRVSRAGSAPVHPRACGEHNATLTNQDSNTGSSPRMWGTPLSAETRSAPERFISAHAGTRVLAAGTTPRCRFIPAHAGEHLAARRRATSWLGSSPRMRGTRVQLR